MKQHNIFAEESNIINNAKALTRLRDAKSAPTLTPLALIYRAQLLSRNRNSGDFITLNLISLACCLLTQSIYAT